MYYGVEPTHIVVLDPFCMWHELEGVDWSETRTKIVLQPGVWPTIMENWPNEVLLFSQSLLKGNSFYEKEMAQMYSVREQVEKDRGNRNYKFTPIIKTQMAIFACSPPLEMFAAQNLGYGKIYLIGVDFAYNTTKNRFTEWIPKDGHWIEEQHPYIKKEQNEKTPKSQQEVTTTNGLLTTVHHLFYKKNMLSAIRLSKQDVTVCGKGAITELPTIDIEKLIETQGNTGIKYKAEKMKDDIDRYLGSVGAYVITTKKKGKENYIFIESELPEREVTMYILDLYQHYHCTECNVAIKANDYNTHNNNECPQCKKPALQQTYECDLEQHLKMIRKYKPKK